MIKYAYIIDEKTGMCAVGLGTDTGYYNSIGMKLLDVMTLVLSSVSHEL